MTILRRLKKYTLLLLICVFACNLLACNNYEYYEGIVDSLDDLGEEAFQDFEDDDEDDILDEESEDDKKDNEEVDPLLPKDYEDFDFDKAMEYCDQPVCNIDDSKEKVVCRVTFSDKVPRSDDGSIYLFELSSYEHDGIDESSRPVCSEKKAKEIIFSVEFDSKKLFSRFFPAILFDGEYIALSEPQYITNPEILAKDLGEYPDFPSKKGLLLDANTIDKDELYNLDVKRVIYNLPLSYVIGETDSPACPTIEYEYDGDMYYFNAYMLAGFDSLFKYLTENGFHTTVIILNDWNEDYPEVMHPLSRHKTGRSYYYAFNTEEEEGTKLIEATAMFLADRYTGGDYGMVYDWVIANEVNQKAVWNYMKTDDVDYYAESFERSFRIFYNAIKSNYAYANVYFSIDQDWNRNRGNNKRYFNAKDFLNAFNENALKRGNYDWGLSVHPYPTPLNNTKFWYGTFDKSEEASVITPMNLSVVTDFMNKPEFLNTKGEVRSIGITELGFCSWSFGEEAQAAAFAYCYYIIEDNEHIDSFLLNRQHDDKGALKSGLALGIYNNDYSEKKIAEVFKNIDTDAGEEYIEEMLKIIGEDSLESALEKAR